MARISEALNHLLIQEMVATVNRTTHAKEEDAVSVIAANSKIESIGYQVGSKFCERAAQNRLIPTEPLEAIKFICKDLWQEIFGKAIDKLQTNHRGVFVLKDFAFKWTSRHSSKSELDVKKCQAASLKFPCGLLRGALSNLGYTAIVTADMDATDPARPLTSFHIKVSPL